MSYLINSIQLHPRRWALALAGIGATAVIISLLRRQGRSKQRTILIKSVSGYDGLGSALVSLERLLQDLESCRYRSDIDRDRYNLISSVLTRLRAILSDLQCFEKNKFESRQQQSVTDTIARSVWSAGSHVGTLSVLSDDSFLSAKDEPFPFSQESFSISIDHEPLEFYREGLIIAEKGIVKYRKSRADICGCESELDFAAKLWCLRQAFDAIISDQSKRRWIIQSGRNMIADLLRQDKKDPRDFYVAFDELMNYMENPNNYDQIVAELCSRKVENVNIWDVLIDFILLDSFDDLRKPPSGVAALVKNPFLSRSMRESTLYNLIWSLIKVKRARLQIADGFVSHFYDISQIVSPPLTLGMLGGSSPEFYELCTEFKEDVMGLVSDLFNPQKVRYTNLSDLIEDVYNSFVSRMESLQVKLGSELLPA